ncbi:MAG TPA: hypothetical protein VHC21_02470 [Candidatus Saccharimonadales bacterium]|nr:hypothetical protein [Candidatus Saccharimonadales bacterium]
METPKLLPILDLEALEDEYAYLQDEAVQLPMHNPYTKRARHSASRKGAPPRPRRSKYNPAPDRPRSTFHLYDGILEHTRDGVNGQPGAPLADIERAEHSRDQLMDTLQNLAELAVGGGPAPHESARP